MLTGSNSVRSGALTFFRPLADKDTERRPQLHVLSKILWHVKQTAMCSEAFSTLVSSGCRMADVSLASFAVCNFSNGF